MLSHCYRVDDGTTSPATSWLVVGWLVVWFASTLRTSSEVTLAFLLMIFRRYFRRKFYFAVANHMQLNLSGRDGVICAILNIEIVATLFTRRSYCIQGKLCHCKINVFDSLRKKFFYCLWNAINRKFARISEHCRTDYDSFVLNQETFPERVRNVSLNILILIINSKYSPTNIECNITTLFVDT